MTFGELINHYLDHELPRLSKSARMGNKSYIKNWIEASLAWSSCRQHEDHANPGVARRSPASRRNQAEDQERSFNHLLARSPLGACGTQSGVRAGAARPVTAAHPQVSARATESRSHA